MSSIIISHKKLGYIFKNSKHEKTDEIHTFIQKEIVQFPEKVIYFKLILNEGNLEKTSPIKKIFQQQFVFQ